MRSIASFTSRMVGQRRSPAFAAVPAIVAIWTLTALGLGSLLLLAVSQGIPPSHLLRDANAVLGAPFYLGAISYTTVVLMAMSAAVSLFAYSVLRQLRTGRIPPGMFLGFGVLSTALFLDDLFLLHEDVIPAIIPSRWTEMAVYAAYGVALLALLFWYRKAIARTSYLFLVNAGVLGMASIVMDQIRLPIGGLSLAIEDAFKVAAIVSWTVYIVVTARSEILQASRPDMPTASGLEE
jgi:hypothetical protein